MIHSISANKKSFRTVRFSEGLNIVLSCRDKESKATDTSNGLGKTTLMHIIDFCLGAEPNREDSLPTDRLQGWTFILEATIAGNHVFISRSVNTPEVVHVRRSDDQPFTWPNITGELQFGGDTQYKTEVWRALLGWAFFGLECELRSSEYRPDERELLSFFIRKQYVNESLPALGLTVRKELSVSYLLGLNWEFLRELDALKAKKKDAEALARSAELKMAEFHRKRDALEIDCRILKDRLLQMKGKLDAFKINEQYAEDERLANEYTAKIKEITNRMFILNSKIESAKKAIRKSRVDLAKIKDVYDEVQFNFPEQLLKTLEDAQRFYEAVSENRSEFLETDIKRMEGIVSNLRTQLEEFKKLKEEKIRILASTGALDQYSKMYEAYAKTSDDLTRKQSCLDDLAKSEKQKCEVKDGQKTAAANARKEYDELEGTLGNAEKCFAGLAKLLYDAKGSLNIKLLDTGRRYGFEFRPSIPYDRASGIKNIRIFAFDMTMFEQQRMLKRGIDFLVHDSLIYDGADPRQVAIALSRADGMTREHHRQYICMLNSTTIENPDFQNISPIKRDSECVKLLLSDASPEQSLLGFRFQ